MRLFLYWNLIQLPGLGAGVTLYAALFCLCTFVYLRAGGHRQTKASLLSLLGIILSTLVFLLFDNPLIKVLNFMFLSATVIYWISAATGRTLEKRISVYILGDLWQQVLLVPFGNFSSCFGTLKSLPAGNKKGKTVIAGALGILIMIPVLAAVIHLLIAADAAFAQVVNRLNFTVSTDTIFQIIMGIPVACYLYGLVYGNHYGRKTGQVTVETVDKMASVCRFAPGVAVYSALTALNLVFIVYFLSQLTYLFSAFNNRLPELMTYAEYARRGFFELCAVAAINLAVIALAQLVVKRERVKVLRMETTALCLFTLMLIMTALSKMVMYINTYGLTQLRVYTTWFMLVLFLIFAVTAVRQFKTFNAARVMVAAFMILFLALSYGNVDGRIAAYNIDRYEKGTLEDLDVQALAGLSDAAVPPMYELYQHTADPNLKAKLKAAIIKTNEGEAEPLITPHETFRDFNLQHHSAQAIREKL